jgi:hypothetical protein
MNRGYLALGAAVVLAAVIGLYLGLRTSDQGRDLAVHHDPGVTRSPEADPGRPKIKVTQPAPGERPPPTEAAGSGAAPDEYMVGGIRIRDHRSGDHARVDIPPAIHPPQGRKIPSQLTSDIAQKLRAVTTECTAGVPKEARGAAPRLEGEILIAIKDHQAQITSATFQLRDVAAGADGPVKQCMEQKSVGVATPAGDEPDVEGYAITLSLRVP